MPETQTHRIAWAIAVLLLTAGTAPAAVPLGTDFSYQAQLKLGGVPLNDSADWGSPCMTPTVTAYWWPVP